MLVTGYTVGRMSTTEMKQPHTTAIQPRGSEKAPRWKGPCKWQEGRVVWISAKVQREGRVQAGLLCGGQGTKTATLQLSSLCRPHLLEPLASHGEAQEDGEDVRGLKADDADTCGGGGGAAMQRSRVQPMGMGGRVI